ncbi:probable lipid-A-disaccharide synthase, mitochondrial isoform X2 [Andrographis paniculata]|uniref:probable lipid-A-disaccharide synthase, mitochondrial isoform X2 n=1 Tax=Andrographis paniculata TaxID=175694 RepID=UPI0021E81E23|nr:probable lipid-A-disaccharide synthase, mitochondrial isoform X2 [Andrographis paniculata]
MLLRTVLNGTTGLKSSFLRVTKRSLYVSGFERASRDGELRVFVVAGEVSGDIIGSRFMNSLKKLSPFPVRFSGVGGLKMAQQGLSSIFPIEDIAVMGIWELLPHLNKFRVKLKEAVESAITFQPHVVLTVDSKGFSFRFLKKLRSLYSHQKLTSPQHFHYVAPSFWAWKGGEARLKGLSEFVDHVFCILPFEAAICRSNGLAATFVGHPTLEDALELKINKCIDEWRVDGNGDAFRENNGISSGSTIISVLPGSRLQEVTRMLPIYSRTMELLKGTFSELTAVIHVAPNKQVEEHIKKAVDEWPIPVIMVGGESALLKYNSFGASKVALCTSGTVAVELQLARLPCVVAYRAHRITEYFFQYKAKVPYISLPNIVLDSPVIPEALFKKCTPSKLASLLVDLINNDGLCRKQISAAGKFLKLLDPQNSVQNETRLIEDKAPSMIAASVVLNFVTL